MWLNKGHKFWDQTLLNELLEGLPDTERRIVVVPGTINSVEEVNEKLAKYPKVLVIITSDEENKFPVDQLDHPDKIVYMTYPLLPTSNVDRFLPIGSPPDAKMIENKKKDLDWFFSGQVNHDSRMNVARVLRGLEGGKLVETGGFSQGLEHKEYYDLMSRAKVVPSPGGAHSPDSFRLYEALEAGAIPIADTPDFWKMLFGGYPFPAPQDWTTLKELIGNLKDRPEERGRVFAWWLRKKRELRYMLEDDLEVPREKLTVLVATSPIPSHPQTRIIEETVVSVRERTNAEIILMIDGVREEQEDRKYNYQVYIHDLLWLCKQWGKCYPMIFDTHQHQANMTREALRCVRTPTVMFMEHDTPLREKPWSIPLDEMCEVIEGGKVNLIRLHYEASVLDVHQHLMPSKEPQMVGDVPLLKCAQWSQRPHLASTEFYRKIIDEYFPVTSRTMIEDKMYGVLENAWFTRGLAGWNDFKVWMYAPEGDIKRSLNLDGREDDPKYPMKYE